MTAQLTREQARATARILLAVEQRRAARLAAEQPEAQPCKGSRSEESPSGRETDDRG